jgi:hypothetical protein
MDTATATRVSNQASDRPSDRPAAARRSAAPDEPRQAAPLDERRAAASLLDLVQGLLHEVPGLISDRVELLSLELSRAGAALGKIVALTVAVAILGITAWTALWVGVVMGLLALDWHWAAALGVVVLGNAGALAWALLQMRRLAGLLKLPATRRHLTLRASAQAVAAKSLPVASQASESGANNSIDESAHHASPAAAVRS